MNGNISKSKDKLYYYIKNNKQFGPFSLAELREKITSPKTLVWREGLPKWQMASDVEELKPFFYEKTNHVNSIPPPMPYKPKVKKRPKKILLIGISILVIAIISTLTFFFFPKKHKNNDNQNNSNNKNTVVIDDGKNKGNNKKDIQKRKIFLKDNWDSFITVEPVCDIDYLWGGVSNIQIVVKNDMEYPIDYIKVRFTIYKENGDRYLKNDIAFEKIPAFSAKIKRLNNSSRGTTVDAEILKVKAHYINLDHTSFANIFN